MLKRAVLILAILLLTCCYSAFAQMQLPGGSNYVSFNIVRTYAKS